MSATVKGLEGIEAYEVDPDSLPEGTVIETLDLTAKPKTPEEFEAEARADHAEEMEEFRESRNERLFTGVKIGGAGLLLLLFGAWLDRKRELEDPPLPEAPLSV